MKDMRLSNTIKVNIPIGDITRTCEVWILLIPPMIIDTTASFDYTYQQMKSIRFA